MESEPKIKQKIQSLIFGWLDYPIGRLEFDRLPAYRIGSHIYRCHGKYRQRRRRRYKPLLHPRLASRPRDDSHPFRTRKDRNDFGLDGRNTHHYGRCDYYLPRLRTTVHPFPLSHLDIGIYITAAAGIANYFLGMLSIKTGA